MTDRPAKSTHIDMEGPGTQLRRARERRGLLLHDVAQELHLDEWMLQALEEDDFTALGAPVFAKGHMRTYGTMLGLNPDDLMIAYYRKRGRDDSPPPITSMMAPESPGAGGTFRGLGWVLAALAAIIVLLLAWAILSRGQDPQTPVATPADLVESPAIAQQEAREPDGQTTTAQPSEMAALAGAGAAAEPQSDVSEQPGAPADVNTATAAEPQSDVSEQPDARADVNTQTAADVAVVAAPESVSLPDSISVRLTLSGESWVEVTDSDGKRLVYEMMSAGRTRTVSGRPPIEVFLGNSRSVQVDVEGQSYAIPRRAVRGNTARFVIDSDSR